MLSHGNSSRSRAAQDQQQTRTVSLGLGHRGTNSSNEETAENSHNNNSSSYSDSSTSSTSVNQGSPSSAQSPPSPSNNLTSKLTLSLQALANAGSSPPTSNQSTSPSSLSTSLSPSSLSSLSSSLANNPNAVTPTVLSDQLLSLYEQTLQKLVVLRSTERTLSMQSGQLLKALQSEESLVTTLNTTLKRIRHEHKKLLSRITAPRWEVRHHYHMTCMEHSLGHRQPHVMDVAEMLPGHLRLYAIARCHAIIKRSFTSSTARAKQERNSAADQIKEGYRQLREVRAEMKDMNKLLDAMNAKTHLLSTVEEKQRLENIIRKHRKQLAALSNSAPAQQAMKGISLSLTANNQNNNNPRPSLSSPTNASAIRLRYLKSLNMAPKPYEARSDTADSSVREEKRRVLESYNNDWKQMMHLFHKLEQQKKRREEQQIHNNVLYSTGETEIPTTTSIAADIAASTNTSETDHIAAASPPPSAATVLQSVNTMSVEDDLIAAESSSPAAVEDVDGELKIVRSYRKRMGFETLPSPLTFGDTEEGLRDIQDPNDAMINEQTDRDTAGQHGQIDIQNENEVEKEREKQIRGILQLSKEIIQNDSGDESALNISTSSRSPSSTSSPSSPVSPSSPQSAPSSFNQRHQTRSSITHLS